MTAIETLDHNRKSMWLVPFQEFATSICSDAVCAGHIKRSPERVRWSAGKGAEMGRMVRCDRGGYI